MVARIRKVVLFIDGVCCDYVLVPLGSGEIKQEVLVDNLFPHMCCGAM